MKMRFSIDSSEVDAKSIPLRESCKRHIILSLDTEDDYFPDLWDLVDFFAIQS